jgi:hypothetical protein
MLYEFAPHLRVIAADFDGRVHAEFSLSDLLAAGFGARSFTEPEEG